MRDNNKPPSSIDHVILWPTLLVLAAICAFLMTNIEDGTKVIKSILTWCEYKLGWAYLLCIIGTSFFSLWLAFGKFNKVQLCAPGEKPQFSIFSWFSMIFMTTMAASIMVWGFVEPVFYYKNPPYGLEPFSSAAYEWALTQTMFHWSPIAYSCYVPFSVGIAYILHVRKKPFFKVSSVCEPIIGERLANGWLGKAIDIMVLFGVVGGMSTSFGMAVPVVQEGFCSLIGVEPSPAIMAGLLVTWTLVFGISVYRGLEKGIKVLSNFNIILASVFIALVALMGPTIFMLKMFVNSGGQMMQNIIRLSTFMDPIEKTGFVESWTVFYWAWYLGFATAVGLFIGRISKGRTVREVVFGSTIAISACVYIIQTVFGGYVIDLQINGSLDVAKILSEMGTNSTVLEIVKSMPLGKIMVFLHTLLLFTFVATSLDSTAFTCASITTVQLTGDEEPGTYNKLLWAIILLAVTGTLAAIGGLSAIQVSSLVFSVPLMFVSLILCMALVKMLNQDFPMKKQNFLTVDYLKKQGSEIN
jgi:BCCT family betaine/carnitine transporter